MGTSAASYIQLHDVRKVYKTAAGEFLALHRINLSFERGEFTAIMGKSGSGKSTLINMITGIDHPTSGSVRIGDIDLYRMQEGRMAEWRGRNIGIVFQFFQLLPTLTVLENILLPMDYCHIYEPAERVSRALAWMELVGLDGMADKLPAALSGGQQQIAAIARALANDPPILIADEPTGNLDSRSANHVLDLFEELASKGKTILLVTHDPTLVRRARRRIVISDGELVDEAIDRALPALPHPQLLLLSKLAVPRSFEPDAVIARQGGLDNGLIIILEGEVHVTRDRIGHAPEVITTLGPGDYVSELEMLELPPLRLSLRAQGPVDTLCVPLASFGEYLNTHPASEKFLREAAVQKIRKYDPTGSLNRERTP
ncbi:MAG: ATP-binding cassette domain-containing protein [Anaerolineales bacterium]